MNKCFKWSLNDQWKTPTNIYNHFAIDKFYFINRNLEVLNYVR